MILVLNYPCFGSGSSTIIDIIKSIVGWEVT